MIKFKKIIPIILLAVTLASCKKKEECTLNQEKYEKFYEMCLKSLDKTTQTWYTNQAISSCKWNAKDIATHCK